MRGKEGFSDIVQSACLAALRGLEKFEFRGEALRNTHGYANMVLEPQIEFTAPQVRQLRDFHADNIIWLPDQSPAQRAGLLDFQDAFLTHPAYDLMSLLTDARTDVPQSVRDQITRLYCERTGDDINQMLQSMAALGIQRNLRILGIFTSAAIRDAKPYHLPSLPRVYSNLMTCAAHPAMGALGFSLRDALPEPTPDYLARITA